MTTKTLAFAASITMLAAISGFTSARPAQFHSPAWPVASGGLDQQVRRAFNAPYPTMATQTVDNNEYRYHGGPKSND